MRSVENEKCRKCGMQKTRDVENAECKRWECKNAECRKWEVKKMQSLKNAECRK